MFSARLYQCVKCYKQVIICSHCDRGNIYCNKGCAQLSRVERQRIANKKYRQSLKGKRAAALRQRRFRERHGRKKSRLDKKVTHQGSRHRPTNALITSSETKDSHHTVVCHFCLQICRSFLRIRI